ncbi:MAG: membrane protein insertase YidC [Sphaerochaetaceae bacterium]|nr:membrane protein insertase YidC [Sphaerochaetaceae bacterium]
MWRFITNLFISPLSYVIEVVFVLFYKILDNFGLSIIGVSLAVQILVLPLYKRADKIQDEERKKQKSMEKWITHIKKTFSGNERYMMISAYYREQNYKPYYALKSSVSLLLQVPFFMAAYQFLSGLQCLNGVSFLFIKDLLKPDALFSIGGFTVNILPILMTVINILSGLIYTNKQPVKEKIQLFIMAGIFLVLLYNSPSGLVLYWTMNNVFSLMKNIFTKFVKKPGKIIRRAMIPAGISLLIFTISQRYSFSTTKMAFGIILSFACFIPELCAIALPRIRKRIKSHTQIQEEKHTGQTFVITGFVLAILTGAIVPLSVVSSSPQEFVMETYGPLKLVFNSFSVAIGFFVIWGGIFFSFSSDKGRKVFIYAYLMLTGLFLVNFFIFGKNIGLISPTLVFEKAQSFSKGTNILNMLASFAGMLVLPVIYKLSKKIVRYLIPILMLSLLSLGTVWTVKIVKEAYPINRNAEVPSHGVFNLSTKGKNVVLFMLDRAISGFVPYIVEEIPEVKEALSDFTYYPNTISFGPATNFGTPPLFGGYEYTPTEINKRSEETLAEKQNEALTVLPLLFSENGYEVTVCDPPYAGYSWTPDLSIYDDYPKINAYNLIGFYKNDETVISVTESYHTRSMFFYGVMKCLPIRAAKELYDDGRYLCAEEVMADGIEKTLAALQALPRITNVVDSDTNTFLMIQNDTPHQPCILNYPEYTMNATEVTKNEPLSRTSSDGSVLDLSSGHVRSHYHVNAVSLIMVSRWIKFMKENGVYDNTRIIIVADHGRELGAFDYMKLSNGIDVMLYNPVLLVKDFKDSDNSSETGMKTSYEFMTHADSGIIAIEGLFDNPVNPFTGKALTNDEKTAHPQIITTSGNWMTGMGKIITQFDTSDGQWYSVHDNIFDVNNWKLEE